MPNIIVSKPVFGKIIAFHMGIAFITVFPLILFQSDFSWGWRGVCAAAGVTAAFAVVLSIMIINRMWSAIHTGNVMSIQYGMFMRRRLDIELGTEVHIQYDGIWPIKILRITAPCGSVLLLGLGTCNPIRVIQMLQLKN